MTKAMKWYRKAAEQGQRLFPVQGRAASMSAAWACPKTWWRPTAGTARRGCHRTPAPSGPRESMKPPWSSVMSPAQLKEAGHATKRFAPPGLALAARWAWQAALRLAPGFPQPPLHPGPHPQRAPLAGFARTRPTQRGLGPGGRQHLREIPAFGRLQHGGQELRPRRSSTMLPCPAASDSVDLATLRKIGDQLGRGRGGPGPARRFHRVLSDRDRDGGHALGEEPAPSWARVDTVQRVGDTQGHTQTQIIGHGLHQRCQHRAGADHGDGPGPCGHERAPGGCADRGIAVERLGFGQWGPFE